MNEVEYLECQEGPDGQHCDLLNRVPYDRQRMIEIGLRNARQPQDEDDAALRGMLWSASDVEQYGVGHKPKVKHMLTGQDTDEIGKASAAVVQPWRERAATLYNAWFAEAMPGPKGSAGKREKPIPSGPRKSRPSATSGRR